MQTDYFWLKPWSQKERGCSTLFNTVSVALSVRLNYFPYDRMEDFNIHLDRLYIWPELEGVNIFFFSTFKANVMVMVSRT